MPQNRFFRQPSAASLLASKNQKNNDLQFLVRKKSSCFFRKANCCANSSYVCTQKKKVMVALFLSILSSTLIIIIFRLLERFELPLFNIIVLNYFSASLLGLLLNTPESGITLSQIAHAPWFYMTIIAGILLIVMFYFIGLSAQKAGVSVTSVASKMSVIIPILFSIIYYNESVGNQKVVGIVVALLAVTLSVIKKQKRRFKIQYIFLPLIIFLGAGLIDSIMKFSQQEYLNEHTSAIFTGMSFFFALVSGLLLSVAQRRSAKVFLKPKVLFTGLFLGVCNFGSIFFLITALSQNFLDSSIIFGLNNVGVVSLSVFAGLVFFGEKLSWLNWLGFVLALTAIFLLSTV